MQTITLTFTGDIGFDKYMKGKETDVDLLDPSVSSFLRDSDHLVVNVEGPLYGGDRAVGGDMAATLFMIRCFSLSKASMTLQSLWIAGIS